MFYQTHVSSLPDCHQNPIHIPGEVGPLNGDGLSSTACVLIAQLHPDTLEPGYPTSLSDDPNRLGEKLNLDALFHGFLNFALKGRHFILAPPIEDKGP